MAVAPRRTRSRPYGALLLLALLIGALGWVLYLRVTDQPLRGPFGLFGSAETPTQEADQGATREIPELGDGMVRAYTSARDIPAYTKISRDDLWNKNQAMLTFVDLPEEYVEENGILASLGDITGRVMSRNKRAGYVFTESDFLPKGTRPGIAGGTPPGMRSLRIPVEL
ncbi:MAG: SAF domain-containing protein, partial [Planctomycetota bacterium]